MHYTDAVLESKLTCLSLSSPCHLTFEVPFYIASSIKEHGMENFAVCCRSGLPAALANPPQENPALSIDDLKTRIGRPICIKHTGRPPEWDVLFKIEEVYTATGIEWVLYWLSAVDKKRFYDVVNEQYYDKDI